jgi:hypothetical protein
MLIEERRHHFLVSSSIPSTGIGGAAMTLLRDRTPGP